MKTKLPINKWTGGALLAGLSLISVPALAEDAATPDSGEVPTGPMTQSEANAQGRLPMTAYAGVAEQFNTKIDNNGGPNASFSITRFNVGLKAPYRLNDDYTLITSFRYGNDYYNFNGVSPRPWRDINTLQAAAVLAYKVDDTWTVYGGGFGKMSANSDVALTKGATGGILAGFNYKVDDTLSLGLGVAVASQLGTHAQILPLITARWKFADDWTLNVGLTDVATMGYGAEVQWHFNDAWDFGFGLQYHQSRFRIASPDGTAGDGVGQEKAATLFADATWHATPTVDVDGFLGVTAGGNLATYDNARNKVQGNNYKPAAIVGIKGSVRF